MERTTSRWGREGGFDDDVVIFVVLVCSIAYNAVIKTAPGDGGRRGNYEGTNIVRHLQPPCSCTE